MVEPSLCLAAAGDPGRRHPGDHAGRGDAGGVREPVHACGEGVAPFPGSQGRTIRCCSAQRRVGEQGPQRVTATEPSTSGGWTSAVSSGKAPRRRARQGKTREGRDASFQPEHGAHPYWVWCLSFLRLMFNETIRY